MDERTNIEIELECNNNLLGWLFGTALIIVAIGLIVGAAIWL
jgi:hypothetical protein